MKNKNMFIQQCAIFIALLVIGSQISITATGVPFTLQTIVLVIIALTSSMVVTTTTVSIYLLMGFIGLPVFANWTGGPAAFQSISGGFLIGFAVMTPLLAIIKFKNHLFTFVNGLIFTFGVYLFGVLGAMIIHKWDLNTSLTWLVKPYVLFDLIKLILGMFIAYRINQLNILETNYNKISKYKLTIKK